MSEQSPTERDIARRHADGQLHTWEDVEQLFRLLKAERAARQATEQTIETLKRQYAELAPVAIELRTQRDTALAQIARQSSGNLT